MTRLEKSVLIVDDDPVFQAITADFLKSQSNLDVVSTHDGAEAIRHIKAAGDAIGLIVLDLNMPDLNGIELIQSLAEISCRVPILFVTGAHKAVVQSAVIIGRGHGLKIVGQLKKPLDYPEFWKIAEGVLFSHRAGATVAA